MSSPLQLQAERMRRDEQVRMAINQRLVESGEKTRLKALLRDKLVECGWRDSLKDHCRGTSRARAQRRGRSRRQLPAARLLFQRAPSLPPLRALRRRCEARALPLVLRPLHSLHRCPCSSLMRCPPPALPLARCSQR